MGPYSARARGAEAARGLTGKCAGCVRRGRPLLSAGAVVGSRSWSRPRPERYETIGRSYVYTRQPDPRIAAAIRPALGNVRRVINIGAGAGSYEPAGLDVLAAEPSATMIAQRPPGAAPAVKAQPSGCPWPTRASTPRSRFSPSTTGQTERQRSRRS